MSSYHILATHVTKEEKTYLNDIKMSENNILEFKWEKDCSLELTKLEAILLAYRLNNNSDRLWIFSVHKDD